MVESIEELRKICQRRKEILWGYRVIRKMSIYVTRLLLSTNITANQISLLSILSLLIGGLLLTLGSYWHSILGALLLHLYSVLDCVDGEVARYESHKRMRTKSASLIGLFLENITHGIVVPFVFMCASFGVFNNLRDVRVLILGLSMSSSFTLYWFSDLLFPEFDEAQYAQTSVNEHSWTARILSKIYEHKTAIEVPGNLFAYVTISFIILVAVALNYLYVVLIFYGITLPPLVLVFLYFRLSNLRSSDRPSQPQAFNQPRSD